MYYMESSFDALQNRRVLTDVVQKSCCIKITCKWKKNIKLADKLGKCNITFLDGCS